MKIIHIDGFDREGPLGDDSLVCDNVNEFYGKRIVKWLCSSCGDADWFKLVPDDYKLKKFEP